MLAAAVSGCGSSPNPTGVDAAPSLRPGVDDSSLVFMGTPNADESAFWTAVRDADDVARATAVTQLKADVAGDPTNGYSEFLIGASSFMPPNTVLSALASGAQPPAFQPDLTAVPILQEGLANLTDPFYLGFDGALLGAAELAMGDTVDGGPTFATASAYNHEASAFVTLLGDLQMQDAASALTDMSAFYELCNGAPVDQGGNDAGSYGAKQNAGALAQRECYSGYYAPHGSSGELLIMGDLQALNGNAQAATAYYNATQSASDYSTWVLAPLVEQRLSGAHPADLPTLGAIASACATCHTNQLP